MCFICDNSCKTSIPLTVVVVIIAVVHELTVLDPLGHSVEVENHVLAQDDLLLHLAAGDVIIVGTLGIGSEVLPVCQCTVTVYATRQDYDNSDVATLEFTLGAGGEVCDTNKDGVVDVADIATIIDKMAGK